MRYVLVKKAEHRGDNSFTQRVSSSGGIPEPKYHISSETLDNKQLVEIRKDPAFVGIVPSIPLKSFKPLRGSPEIPTAGPTASIQTIGAHASRYSGRHVTIAVLDTGIDTSHPAFQGLENPPILMDFTKGGHGNANSAEDTDGHGTHVAGTLFGGHVNGVRIGVAPSARAVVGKVLGNGGCSTETIITAIQWALRSGADIISMSVGMDFPGLVRDLQIEGYPPDIAASRALECYRSNLRFFDRMSYLISAYSKNGGGAILVAAAGNESRRDVCTEWTVSAAPPSSADGFISVGALTADGSQVAHFSNTGCSLSAPGVNIVSAKLGSDLSCLSGTSMAAPHAAGVIALWIEKLFGSGSRPLRWTEDVQHSLFQSLLPVSGLSRWDAGSGLVQAP